MGIEKHLKSIAEELGLKFSEEVIETMYKLIEAGMPSDNLVKLVREVESEKVNEIN